MRPAVSLRIAFLLMALLPGLPAIAPAQPRASVDDVEQLKNQLAALQKQMAELAARIDAVQAGAPAPAAPPQATPEEPLPPAPAPVATAQVPPGAEGAGGPTGALPVYGNVTAASKIFNPDIAVIGNFLGAAGKSPGGGEPSLELHEAELSFPAIVEPYARADFFLAYGPDEMGVEEGFLTYPTLPGGPLA